MSSSRVYVGLTLESRVEYIGMPLRSENIPGPPSQTIFSNFARVHTYIDWGYLLDIYSNQNSSTIFGIL